MMQKLIDMWFEAEQMALDFSQTKFYEVSVKVLKTVILFVICLLALSYIVVAAFTGYAMNKLRKVEKQPLPKTVPVDNEYTETGLPKEVAKKGESMSESDYENLRKVL